MRRVASHSGHIFWDFMPTSLVEICRSYAAIRCLNLQVYPEHGGGRRFRNFGRFLRDYTALYAKRQQSSEAIAPTETPSSRISVSNINHHIFYCDGQHCLRNHDLLNYQMDLFKTDIFEKRVVRDWWQFHLLLLIHSQKCAFNKEENVINFQYCINRKPREVRFHWPQVEAALSILTSYFLFTHARKLQLLIYTLLMIHWSPTEITQHEALVSKILNLISTPTNAHT